MAAKKKHRLRRRTACLRGRRREFVEQRLQRLAVFALARFVVPGDEQSKRRSMRADPAFEITLAGEIEQRPQPAAKAAQKILDALSNRLPKCALGRMRESVARLGFGERDGAGGIGQNMRARRRPPQAVRSTPISSSGDRRITSARESPSRTPGCASSATRLLAASPSAAQAMASRARTPAGLALKRIAAGIIDADPPAQQFSADAPRQFAVRRHQRRRLARRLQRLAHRDGEGQRLLALVGRLDQATPAIASSSCARSCPRAPGDPLIGRIRRTQSLRYEARPRALIAP